MKTFKVLGLLMSYPEEAWIAHLDELLPVLTEEDFLPGKQLRAVQVFIGELQINRPVQSAGRVCFDFRSRPFPFAASV